MKTLLFCLGLLLLTGCGKDDGAVRGRSGQAERHVIDPTLAETQPLPAPDTGIISEEPSSTPKAPPAEITDDSWMARQLRKEEQVQSLRDYAAKAGPDDPFSMTEKQIEAFSKLDNPVVY